jgi:hypothetical protein
VKDYREARKRRRRYINDFFKETFRSSYKPVMKPVQGNHPDTGKVVGTHKHRQAKAVRKYGFGQFVVMNRATRRRLAREEAKSYKDQVA